MKARILVPDRSEAVPSSLLLPSLAILVLTTALCATALGATSPESACDRTTDLTTLDVPVSDLSATTVGHVSIDDIEEEILYAEQSEEQPSAPTIDLAPRVELIMQAIFSAAAVDDQATETADDATEADSAETADTSSVTEEEEARHSIQRQMFRTDI